MSHHGGRGPGARAAALFALVLPATACGTRPEVSKGRPEEGAPGVREAEPGGERSVKPEAAKAGAVSLTEDGFEKAISTGVVLVDFWAEWCPPCRKQGPIVDRLAGEYKGRALVAKVNVDEARGPAAKLGVEAIPTLVLFKNGEEVRRLVGLNSEEKLRALLEEALGEK